MLLRQLYHSFMNLSRPMTRVIIDKELLYMNGNLTLNEWLDYWFQTYAKRTVKRSTAISYLGYITNHISPIIGNIRLSEVDTTILQEYFNYEMDNGNKKTGKSLSPKTLHNIKLMLHKSFKKAIELDFMKLNYAEYVELPKIRKPDIKTLSASEQHNLLNILKYSDEKLYFGVFLSLTTGMRLGEVIGLRWSDVDLQDNIIHIRRTANRLNTLDESSRTRTEIVVGTPKSENSIRDIPITDMIHTAFIDYKIKYQENFGKIRKDDYIVMLRRGYPVEPKTMQDCFQRIISKAGIKEHITFHGLRHTFATRAVEQGVDIKTLSVLLGHSDVSFTLSRYYHVSEKQKRKAMNLIGR